MKLLKQQLEELENLFKKEKFEFDSFEIGILGVNYKKEDKKMLLNFGVKNDEVIPNELYYTTKNIEREDVLKYLEKFRIYIKLLLSEKEE